VLSRRCPAPVEYAPGHDALHDIDVAAAAHPRGGAGGTAGPARSHSTNWSPFSARLPQVSRQAHPYGQPAQDKKWDSTGDFWRRGLEAGRPALRCAVRAGHLFAGGRSLGAAARMAKRRGTVPSRHPRHLRRRSRGCPLRCWRRIAKALEGSGRRAGLSQRRWRPAGKSTRPCL
jgi:hypothetical protein